MRTIDERISEINKKIEKHESSLRDLYSKLNKLKEKKAKQQPTTTPTAEPKKEANPPIYNPEA